MAAPELSISRVKTVEVYEDMGTAATVDARAPGAVSEPHKGPNAD